MKRLILALALLALPIVAGAQDEPAKPEAEKADARGEGHDLWGLEVHPYVGLIALRPTGSDSADAVSENWTIGLTAGVDVDLEPFWVGASYDLYDVLDDDGSYPFDGAFALHLGLYRGNADPDAEIPIEPYAAITLTRPSGPDEWSTGFEAGIEFLLDPLYLGGEYELHDVLTSERDEVYPFDGTFTLSVGCYW